jgi:hypothetical protein
MPRVALGRHAAQAELPIDGFELGEARDVSHYMNSPIERDPL